MALIKCPNCQKDISDKANACPNCGYIIPKSKNIFCSECGKPIPLGATVCSNCGCPIDEKSEPIVQVEVYPVKKSKKGLIKSVIIIIVVVAIGALVVPKIQSYKYDSNLSYTINLIVDNSVMIEETGNLMHDVWYNSVFEQEDSKTDKFTKNEYGEFNEDFNDSLNNLYNDPEFSSKVYSLKENHEEIISNMKSLTNPPAKYKEAYSHMKTLYNDYVAFYNIIMELNGNLLTYTEDFNEADEKISEDLEILRLYY